MENMTELADYLDLTEEERSLALKICTDKLLDVPCEQCPLYGRCKSGEVVEDVISSEALDNVKAALEGLGAVCAEAVDRFVSVASELICKVAEAIAGLVSKAWSFIGDWFEERFAKLGGKEYYFYRHAKKKRVRKKYRKRLLSKLFGTIVPP